MSDPYLGEIRMFGGGYAPDGWAFCWGQQLPIAEHRALFDLIGTRYGGDGQTTFALPDLASRVPVGSDGDPGSWGRDWVYGARGGTETVTLARDQMPVHDHDAAGSTTAANTIRAEGAVPGSLPSQGTTAAYGTRPPTGRLSGTSVAPAGGDEPHGNMQPYVAVSCIISLRGTFPATTSPG